MSLLKRALICALMMAGLSQGAASEDLRFAHFVAPTHTLTEAIVRPLTEGISGAGLSLQVYPAGELGANPADQYLRVLQGVADIVWSLPGYTSSQFPLSMLTELPGVQSSNQTGADLLWNAWEAGHLAKEYPAVTPLAFWTAEPAVLILRGRAVTRPEEMNGLKIRVSSAVAAGMVSALDAAPVQMPAGDVYNALQTGLIDGTIVGASAIRDFRYDEVLSHVVTGLPLGNQAFYVVANSARLNALPEPERAALLAASGRELSRHAERLWNEKAAAALDALRARDPAIVVELSADQRSGFEATLFAWRDVEIARLGAENTLTVMRGAQ